MNEELILHLLPVVSEFIDTLGVEQKERLMKGLAAYNDGRESEILELLDSIRDMAYS